MVEKFKIPKKTWSGGRSWQISNRADTSMKAAAVRIAMKP
jgi:hypothetical protein